MKARQSRTESPAFTVAWELAGGRLAYPPGAQGKPLPRREFFRCALELATRRQNVAAARGPHRRRIARVEDDFGKGFDAVPIRAFVPRTGPRIEGDQVDFSRDPLEQLHQRLGVRE